MNKGYTKRIVDKIERTAVGSIITLHDFPNIPAATANTILNRVAKQQSNLIRVKKGVFSKCAMTRFGIAKASSLEILATEISKDANKCFGGLFLFNQLGLTTQVPTTIEVLNNKSSYVINLNHTRVRYVKIRPKITKKTKSYIATLEVLKKIRQIPDGDFVTSLKWVKQTINHMSSTELKQLTKISLDYPPRVRAILGNLLQAFDKTLSNSLKNSLNKTSYYHVGSLFKYLTEPEEWRMKT